jgi:putative flavoprotein involved in K+ transport
MIYDTIVIGSGQAGLAAGYYLQQAGLSFLILEAGAETSGSWPHYYDSLTLNTPARYSALPGLAFPGDPARYPARDEVVAYLGMYAAAFGLPIVHSTRVRRVERAGENFRVLIDDDRSYRARTVVAATGFFGSPYRPALAGQEQYRGHVMHMAEYRRPDAFRGQRIVIVGGGNGAVRIGVELGAVARVTLATRAPIRTLPQRLFGRDIHAWLSATGLDRTQWLGDRTAPVYLSAADRAALAAGSPGRRPMFARLDERGVIWRDGSAEAVDTVIFATGYQPQLGFLAGLGALDGAGHALQQHGRSLTVPGIYYAGLPRQRTAASATLRGVGADARIVVEQIRRRCDTAGTPARAAPAPFLRPWFGVG